MKQKVIYSIIIILSFGSVTAQNYITGKSGKIFTTFRFKDSQGEKDKGMSMQFKSFYSIGYSRDIGNSFVIGFNAGYREMGAKQIVSFQKIEWNLNYLDINFSFAYNIINKDKIKLYAGVMPYYASLLNGEQQIGPLYFNLNDNNIISNSDYGINGFAGIKSNITESLFVNLEYIYGLGLCQFEKETDTKEKSMNRFTGLSLGIGIKI